MIDLRTEPSEVLRNAALELFARDGYDATSIQDVADAVGYTKANVLYHFGSKQSLFEAALTPAVEAFEAIARDLDPRDEAQAAAWFDRVLEFLIEHDSAVAIIINQVSSMRDQPIIARVRELIFMLDSGEGEWAQSIDQRIRMRHRVALAGAAFAIALRRNAAIAGQKQDMDDVEFSSLLTATVREIVGRVAGERE